MPAQRIFLSDKQPTLKAALGYLRDTYLRERAWDLGQVILVVPGGLAGRRLLELLVVDAAEHKLEFVPPTITTVGALPELLYIPRKVFADTLTQELAWSEALRELSPAHLAAIIPHPPQASDINAWRELGRLLRVRHTELLADTLDFADVARLGAGLPSFPDEARWLAMSVAQRLYLDKLDTLSLWDIQTARKIAIEKREITTDKQIVLIGTVEITRTLREFLGQIEERVTSLVFAPPEFADRFDAFGGLIPAAWKDQILPLDDNMLVRVDGPAQQAEAAALALGSYGGKYRGDQITIGVPDERLVPHLQRELKQCGVPARWVVGKVLRETSPFKFLEAVAMYLADPSSENFASLVRHPDVYDWLTTGEEPTGLGFLAELDSLISEFFVLRIDPAAWPARVKQKSEEGHFKELITAIAKVQALVGPLTKSPQKMGAWTKDVLELLRAIYLPRLTKPGHDVAIALAAIDHLREGLQGKLSVPEAIQPYLSASDAIEWTLQELRKEPIPAPSDPNAVELLGWLELPLDDAPALVVTTFNEGFTPDSVSADAFLPDGLRKHLGLIDNDRRYARDAYFLSVILRTRETMRFISGRRDTEGNPLAPSRLIFATSQDKIVERSLRYFVPLGEAPRRRPLIGAGLPAPRRSQLTVPLPSPTGEVLERLRVTQFRDYLACPYRFYLQHILRLEAGGETPEELAANTFGDLVHLVLQSFGQNESVRELTSEEHIFAYLTDQLAKLAGARLGEKHRLAAVELQLEQIRARFRRFAAWQANRSAEGWRIIHTEVVEEGVKRELDVDFPVDGKAFRLGGRIDRIDRHDGSGKVVVFDYKTGDSADGPERSHRKRGEWVDLQLPLYRHLARGWGIEGEISLGYILLPKSLESIGDSLATWSEEELAQAEETAREVIRGIRASRYWPPSEPPAYADDFTGLCQDRRLGGRLLAEGSE